METSWSDWPRLSAVLSVLAGFVGAAAFTHSAGYFVTFMTGNTERSVVGFFEGDSAMAVGAIFLLLAFLIGVIVASFCRRYWWTNHPHGATMLTTVALAVSCVVDVARDGFWVRDVGLAPILFVSFGMGALNTSFVKNGETAIPLTYVTGTVVKLGQGIERHISGGEMKDWLGYAVQYLAFTGGALCGGIVSLFVGGTWMLIAATVASAIATAYTYKKDPEHVAADNVPTASV